MDQIQKSFPVISLIFGVLIFCFLLVSLPLKVDAQLDSSRTEDGTQYIRSLESLRDLDYQTWQVVVYNHGRPPGSIVLRIVGYPGKLRIDHPQLLHVQSGRKEWDLADITLGNKKLLNDPRAAAVEFELEPLLLDLNNNRPLRLFLPGVINELPIPPYIVSEWRSFL